MEQHDRPTPPFPSSTPERQRGHLAAVDDWLSELERAHGPVPAETSEWAAGIVEHWEAGRA